MDGDFSWYVTVFVLSLLLGFVLIGNVPSTLHTPLMSATNSVHGIVVIAGMSVAATAEGAAELTVAFVAVAFGAMNVVGGYQVTERMLAMFDPHRPPNPERRTP